MRYAGEAGKKALLLEVEAAALLVDGVGVIGLELLGHDAEGVLVDFLLDDDFVGLEAGLHEVLVVLEAVEVGLAD